MNCRHCQAPLESTFIDLGSAPPSNAYLTEDTLHEPEVWFPLRVLVCETCWLVQTEDFANAEALFSADYAYFSSQSSTWLRHAERYVEAMVGRFGLGTESLVVEIAANDGYLLQFVQERGIPCLGVEPTASTATAAEARGLRIVREFFGAALGERLADAEGGADLLVANNVLAHVPDINDFVRGFAALLKPDGVATFEFPHLLRLIDQCQFDTIYHEHFSYLSLTAVDRIFSANGLYLFDVETLPTHGGSLRVFAQRADSGRRPRASTVSSLLRQEQEAGLMDADTYGGFQGRVDRIKDEVVRFLIETKEQGRSIIAYGAAAKGNTLLNYAGIRPDLLPFVCDAAPSKQGKYLPGSRIPIHPPELIEKTRPDLVFILPWNLGKEIETQLHSVPSWGGKFLKAIPSLTIS